MSTIVEPVEEKREPLVRPLYIGLGVAGILLVSGLLIWLFVWLASTQAPTIEAVRDIFIIVLALESCLFGIALILLLIMVIRLVNVVEFEIKPILNKTNETVSTIRGTTVFVSDNVVKPVTNLSAKAVGISAALRTLFGDPSRNLRD